MLTEIPLTPKKKRNEWKKSAVLLGIVAGLNAAIWGILLNFWIG